MGEGKSFWVVSASLQSEGGRLRAVCDDQNGLERRKYCNRTSEAPSPPCASLPDGETLHTLLLVCTQKPVSTLCLPIHSSAHLSSLPPSSLSCPPSSLSGTQQLLDKVPWHAVEEEAQHDEQQQGQHDLDDQPLVAVAHQVADGFQRA